MSGDDTATDLDQKFGIAELLRRTAAAREKDAAAVPPQAEGGPESAVPPLDELAPLPKPGDAYKAYSRPSGVAHPLATLHLLTGDGQKWAFPYSGLVEGPHMLSIDDDPGKGAVLVLKFAASIPVEVLIGGTRLDELHITLSDHRIRWVREWPPGRLLKDDGSPVVRSLIVRPVSAEMAKGWPVSPQGGVRKG